MPSLGLNLLLYPPPRLLPLAEDGPVRSWLALLCSSSFFLRTGWQYLRLGLFAGYFSLSLLLSYSLSCYLTLAPSDCPQGIQALP